MPADFEGYPPSHRDYVDSGLTKLHDYIDCGLIKLQDYIDSDLTKTQDPRRSVLIGKHTARSTGDTL